MRRRFVLVVVLSLILFVPAQVGAQQSTPAGTLNIRGKIQQGVENIKERVEQRQTNVREKVLERVRQATKARWGVLNRMTNRTEALLNKLQERIDKAKIAGKDVTEAENLMADARSKLNEARMILVEFQGKETTAVDKTAFQTIQGKFQAVHKNLNVVRQDGAKIIRILKGFNSATSKGQNLQKTGTTSGTSR